MASFLVEMNSVQVGWLESESKYNHVITENQLS